MMMPQRFRVRLREFSTQEMLPRTASRKTARRRRGVRIRSVILAVLPTNCGSATPELIARSFRLENAPKARNAMPSTT